MSKKIAAGDTLTVGDLTRAYIGAEIEVGTLVDITHRFTLGGFNDDWHSQKELWTSKVRVGSFYPNAPVTIITPPPVVQPDEPTILGQCIRIEGDDEWRAVFIDQHDDLAQIRDTKGHWWNWTLILERAGDCQIIVSDPPRWPDETPAVPERIEVGDWPENDEHLREWEWIDRYGDSWRWEDRGNRKSGWNWNPYLMPLIRPAFGPWTRREHVN